MCPYYVALHIPEQKYEASLRWGSHKKKTIAISTNHPFMVGDSMVNDG